MSLFHRRWVVEPWVFSAGVRLHPLYRPEDPRRELRLFQFWTIAGASRYREGMNRLVEGGTTFTGHYLRYLLTDTKTGATTTS